MSQYIAIATIRIEHNYYNPPVNRFVDLKPTSETQKLMRQRGVMFMKSDDCEWQWIMPDDSPGFMEKDILEVSMTVCDPYFPQQIEGNGYDMRSLYKFKMGNGVVEVNADHVWIEETDGQRQGNEFCRIVLKPVEIALERLRKQEICPPKFTLRFHTKAYYWEYIYIFKDDKDEQGKELVLRTPGNMVEFSPSEKYEETNWGPNVWRIVSTERISLKKEYNIPLQLFIGTRIESRFVSPPQMGKHRSDSPDTIREICYIRKQ